MGFSGLGLDVGFAMAMARLNALYVRICMCIDARICDHIYRSSHLQCPKVQALVTVNTDSAAILRAALANAASGLAPDASPEDVVGHATSVMDFGEVHVAAPRTLRLTLSAARSASRHRAFFVRSVDG